MAEASVTSTLMRRELQLGTSAAGITGVLRHVDDGDRAADLRRHVRAGAKPVGVAVSPDNRFVYVTNGHGNSVAFVDAQSLNVVATVPVGRRPWGIAITPDGRKRYTANGLSGDSSGIDIERRRVSATIPTGAGAWGVVIGR